MSALIKPRFTGVDKKKICDAEHIEDYQNAAALGRVRLGKLCLYYRDLGKKYYVPYEYIDRMYTKIEVCPENEFANNEQYYRLMLVHGGKEFANLIFEKKETINELYRQLLSINPNIIKGIE